MKRYFLSLGLLFFTLSVNAQYEEREWKKRDQWMDVTGILEALDLKVGETVADLGSHEGYMTLHLAKTVGEKGQVYAVDVVNYKLRQLQRNMKKHKVSNVKTIHADYDDPKLPESSLDAIIIMDTYHEITAYEKVLGHVKAALKPGARLVMIEEIDEHRLDDSRADQVKNHDLSINYAREELEAAGFSIYSEKEHFGEWENKKGKRIWLLVATRPSL